MHFSILNDTESRRVDFYLYNKVVYNDYLIWLISMDG
jgi:hypothetical protein